MAIIGAHIIRDLPEEYKIYAEKDFTFNKIKQPNRNGLLWDKTIKRGWYENRSHKPSRL